MVDYKRFDDIQTDSDEDEKQAISNQHHIPSSSSSIPTKITSNSSINKDTPNVIPMTKKGKEGRIKFEHDGRTIYEWEQNLNEVNIYIEPPKDLPTKLIDIVISHLHLKVGIVNTTPFIDEDTGGPVKVKESLWTLADGELMISLQKMNKAEAWDCALKGHTGQQLDDFTKEETKKKILLERFQEEHPGFDFSSAEFNGQVPDAREFMGGVKHF